MIPSFAWAAVVVAAVAAVYDVRQRRIPNWLTFGAIVAAPIAHAVFTKTGAALHAAEMSLLGAAVCGIAPLLLWRMHAVGGGDVKLVTAVGALAGPSLGVQSLFLSCLLALGFVLVRLSWNGTLLRTLGSGLVQIANPFLPKGRRVPIRHELIESLRFGPAVCAGVAVAVVLQGGLS